MNKRLFFHVIFFALFASVAFAADSKTAAKSALILKPVLFYGIVLGLYELFLIHADENFKGSHWLGHGIQAIGIMIIAIFLVMNVQYAMDATGFSKSASIPSWLKSALTFQILIGVLLNIKIHSVSAVIHTQGVAARGLAEHWSHTLLVSALVVAVPYAHAFLGQFLPVFFR